MPFHKTIEAIINTKIGVLSSNHLINAIDLKRYGIEKKIEKVLLYSALEFRLAIERYIFEWHFIIKYGKGFTKSDERKAGDVKEMLKAIKNNAGGFDKYERVLFFNRLWCKYSGLPQDKWTSVVDFKKLERFWAKLSDYLHMKLEEFKIEEVNLGYKLLDEVEAYLWNNLRYSSQGWVREDTLTEEMVNIRNKYIEGVISDDILDLEMKKIFK